MTPVTTPEFEAVRPQSGSNNRDDRRGRKTRRGRAGYLHPVNDLDKFSESIHPTWALERVAPGAPGVPWWWLPPHQCAWAAGTTAPQGGNAERSDTVHFPPPASRTRHKNIAMKLSEMTMIKACGTS